MSEAAGERRGKVPYLVRDEGGEDGGNYACREPMKKTACGTPHEMCIDGDGR